MNEPRPVYLEARSAVNGLLLTVGLLPTVAEIAFLVVGVAANQPWVAVPMGVLLLPLLVSVGLLYRNWPTGIRLDAAGITIGAVRSARAAARRPTVNHQGWGLYTCPWSAVLGVRIVTERSELRQIRNSPEYHTLTNRWTTKRGIRYCNIGVLASPFMRAALTIEINPSAITASAVRPARFYSNYKDGQFSHLVRPQLSLTWVVPTRHPEALSAVLQTISGGWSSVTE